MRRYWEHDPEEVKAPNRSRWAELEAVTAIAREYPLLPANTRGANLQRSNEESDEFEEMRIIDAHAGTHPYTSTPLNRQPVRTQKNQVFLKKTAVRKPSGSRQQGVRSLGTVEGADWLRVEG